MSIYQVAKRAGVSPGTVSNVINGVTGVSESMMMRVRQAMDDIGYVPPPPGKRRGPRRQTIMRARAGTIALVCLGINPITLERSPVHASLKYGVQTAANKYDMTLMILDVPDLEALEQWISPQQVDGLLMLGQEPTGGLSNVLRQVPYVWLLGHPASTMHINADRVSPDNVCVGWIVAEHLIARKHQHVAYLQPYTQHAAMLARGRAFVAKVRDAGLTCTILGASEEINHPPFGKSAGPGIPNDIEALVQEMLDITPRVTAVFVPVDYFAAQVHRILQRAGVRVGHDIHIAGCNNEVNALAGLHPRPTTVDTHPDQIGWRGVEQLLSLISYNSIMQGESRGPEGTPVRVPAWIRVQPTLLVGDEP